MERGEEESHMKCSSVSCRNTEDFRREGSFRICNVCGARIIVLRNGLDEREL